MIFKARHLYLSTRSSAPRTRFSLQGVSFFFFQILFISSLISISCRSDNGRIFWVDESRNIKLALDLSAGDLSSHSVNLIGPDGLRVPSGQFNFGSGEFSFQVDNDSILKESKYSLAESVPAMGDALPEYSERAAAVARVELRATEITGDSGKTLYTQLSIPLLQSDIVAASQDIFVDQIVKLKEVSYRKVKVTDLETGELIQKASVIAVVSGSFTSEKGENLAGWKSDLYKPIRELTNENGEAYLLPLNHELAEKSAYSVIAWASGYCTYVSEEFLLSDESVPNIKLLKCEDASDTVVGFKTRFTSDYNVFEDQIDSVAQNVGYITTRKVNIRVDSLSPVMRGIKLRITEKHIAGGQENPSIPLINFDDEKSPLKFKFISEITFDAPFLFTYSNLENGDFQAHIFSSASENETSVQDTLLTDTLFFKKNTSPPDLTFVQSLVINGAYQSGIISGVSGSKFYVESELCTAGMELGLADVGSDAVFSACENSIAVFEKDKLSLFNDSGSTGGNLSLNVYLKDRFKLVNEDDQFENKNRINVFIDYGKPDLSTSPLFLGTEIGFAPAGAQKGSDTGNYFFPTGTLTGNVSDTVIINPANVESQVVFRASAPGKCRTNSGVLTSTADGTNDGTSGVTIEKWIIAKSEEDLVNGTLFSCVVDGVPTDMPVKSDYINFPSEATQNATFFLKVIDSAGHESDPYQYAISPCPVNVESTAGTSYCWKN